MTLAMKISGEAPVTIERVMMNHLLMTMAMDDDSDGFPIIMHYQRG